MSWHDQTPWRRRHQQTAVSAEQRIDEIEGRCRSGDISLRQAIEAAFAVGKAHAQVRQEPAATTEE